LTKKVIEPGNIDAVAVRSANMPVATMVTVKGYQFLVGTETEIAGSFQAVDVISSVSLGTVAFFVAKSFFELGAR
jgi:hypothetical protein